MTIYINMITRITVARLRISTNVVQQTFLKKAIKEDGGIPGFEAFADKTPMWPDLTESWAVLKAAIVSFVAEEVYKITYQE